jgi:hypothetical protein
MDKSESRRELVWLGVFGAAFGYLEAAVVVYLRAIAYPEGFYFPLKTIPPFILAAEVGREAATLAMLAAVALAVGGPRLLKLSRFLFCFGLWDIFYYAGLKVLLGWPMSLLTWDILFLIPVPWSAPVLAPALIAAFFVVAGAYGVARRGRVRTYIWHWLLGAAAAAGIVTTFVWNVGALRRGNPPGSYPWALFGAAFVAMVTAFAAVFARNR